MKNENEVYPTPIGSDKYELSSGEIVEGIKEARSQQREIDNRRSNANSQAYPYMYQDYGGSGLTKREKACIELGIPETGDPELDDLIRKAERKKIAAQTMQGLWANPNVNIRYKGCEDDEIPRDAVILADALLNQLEATNEE